MTVHNQKKKKNGERMLDAEMSFSEYPFNVILCYRRSYISSYAMELLMSDESKYV